MTNVALMKHIGKHLQKARKKAGYKSAKEFAAKMGINVGTYTSYEQGIARFNIETAWDFADALDCTIDELCGHEVTAPMFADSRQAALNACYEGMNAKGKETLVSVARSMEKDIANRIVKDRQEDLEDNAEHGKVA